MKAQMNFAELGSGGGNNACLETFTDSDMTNCTDANPITISGSFEGVSIIAKGIYNVTSGYRDEGFSTVDNPVFGTTYQVNLGKHGSSNQSWRKVTVYSDRVVIGSGGMNATTNSDNGLIQTIAVR